MKYFAISFLLFISSSGFAQNIIKQDVSAKEWADSFEVNLEKVVGKEMNQFSVTSDKGILYTNDSLSGKVTLINFWIESCVPCIAEFDGLNKLYEKFKSNKKFRLIAFTYETPEAIKRIKKEYKFEFEVIPVSREECYRLNFNYGFPFNIIIDQSSKVANIHLGGPGDKSEVEKSFNTTLIPEIKKLLDNK